MIDRPSITLSGQLGMLQHRVVQLVSGKRGDRLVSYGTTKITLMSVEGVKHPAQESHPLRSGLDIGIKVADRRNICLRPP